MIFALFGSMIEDTFIGKCWKMDGMILSPMLFFSSNLSRKTINSFDNPFS